MASKKASNLAAEIGKRQPFTVPEAEAYLNLIRTADQLSAAFARLFRQHGITPAQYNALRILRGHGVRVPTRRIAAEMVTREPDITRLIDRLEQAGLVQRERCTEDRRVVWVTITPNGEELLVRLDRPVLELHRQQLGHLSTEDLHTLSQLLVEARQHRAET
jgi:DNA-binding MarR family transcriptional regulator